MGKKYAVIALGGRQYEAEEGGELVVAKVEKEEGETMETDQVLLFVDGQKRQVGKPYVNGVRVKLGVVEQLKGPKIKVAVYKAKSRYRRRLGHRPLLTRVRVEKFELPNS